MSIYPTKSYPVTKGLSEFDILAASHKFLREDNNNDDSNPKGETSTVSGSKTWEDRLAEKYYENLYREFAVCDLKHYKSGNFALRWRTESEVISGAGESTCGNTRCKYHLSSFSSSTTKKRKKEPRLTTLELPFAYVEHGEPKNALVKVVLCPRCVKKLMWKRMKEKQMKETGDDGMLKRSGEEEEEGVSGAEDASEDEEDVRETKNKGKERARDEDKEATRPNDKQHRSRRHEQRERHSRRRNSRSRSPRRSHSKNHRNPSYHK